MDIVWEPVAFGLGILLAAVAWIILLRGGR